MGMLQLRAMCVVRKGQEKRWVLGMHHLVLQQIGMIRGML